MQTAIDAYRIAQSVLYSNHFINVDVKGYNVPNNHIYIAYDNPVQCDRGKEILSKLGVNEAHIEHHFMGDSYTHPFVLVIENPNGKQIFEYSDNDGKIYLQPSLCPIVEQLPGGEWVCNPHPSVDHELAISVFTTLLNHPHLQHSPHQQLVGHLNSLFADQ